MVPSGKGTTAHPARAVVAPARVRPQLGASLYRAQVATIADVDQLSHALPEVVDGERRGSRSWAVAGKTFAWERPFSKADIRRFGDDPVPAGPIIAVVVEDLVDKDAVLAQGQPGFFTIPHFDGYAAVLIQLTQVRKRDLREALVDGWLACAPRALAHAYLSADTVTCVQPRRSAPSG